MSTAPAAPATLNPPVSRHHRPPVVGPDSPAPPYPLQLSGAVTRGFGRGARELGIPTANLPDSSLGPLNDLHLTGIYYGFARIHPLSPSKGQTSLPSPSTTTANPESSSISHDTSHAPISEETQKLQSLPAEIAPYPPDSVPGQIDSGPKALDGEDEGVWPMVMSVGWNPFYGNEKITAEVHIMHPFAHDFYHHKMSVLVLGYIRPELDYVSKDALVDDIKTDVQVAFNCLARPGYAGFANDPFLLESPSGLASN